MHRKRAANKIVSDRPEADSIPQSSGQFEAWQGMLRVRRCLIPEATLESIAPAELHEAGDVASPLVSLLRRRHFTIAVS